MALDASLKAWLALSLTPGLGGEGALEYRGADTKAGKGLEELPARGRQIGSIMLHHVVISARVCTVR